jgi:hypothetical protein
MALPVRPLTEGFALAYAWDPAFESDRDGYLEEYRRCVETLDFSPLLRAGEQPTLFHFRPLKASELRKLDLGNVGQAAYLAFRLCLARIENGGSLEKIDRAVDPGHVELGKILSVRCTDVIDALPVALGRPVGDLITDLGVAVLGRCGDTRPL